MSDIGCTRCYLYRILRISGFLLVIVAIGPDTRNWIGFAIVVIPSMAALSCRIQVEEQALRTAFGMPIAVYSSKTRAWFRVSINSICARKDKPCVDSAAPVALHLHRQRRALHRVRDIPHKAELHPSGKACFSDDRVIHLDLCVVRRPSFPPRTSVWYMASFTSRIVMLQPIRTFQRLTLNSPDLF